MSPQQSRRLLSLLLVQEFSNDISVLGAVGILDKPVFDLAAERMFLIKNVYTNYYFHHV